MPAYVLVIEDDIASRELVRYLLEYSGHHVTVANDGAAGIELARALRPDLVICDLQMPELNGYEVIKRLHQDPQWRRVPIIAVTAFSMAGDRETALQAGFDEHVTKPIDPEKFVRQIEVFLPPAPGAALPRHE